MLPEYPESQLQVYELIPSMQVPPFWQGLEAQSSMSIGKIIFAYYDWFFDSTWHRVLCTLPLILDLTYDKQGIKQDSV